MAPRAAKNVRATRRWSAARQLVRAARQAWTIRHAERDALYASFRGRPLRASTRTELRPAGAAAVVVLAGDAVATFTRGDPALRQQSRPRDPQGPSLDPDTAGGFFGRRHVLCRGPRKDPAVPPTRATTVCSTGSCTRRRTSWRRAVYMLRGDCATTRDGKVDAAGAQLFTERAAPEVVHKCCSLRGGAHALVAEAGADCGEQSPRGRPRTRSTSSSSSPSSARRRTAPAACPCARRPSPMSAYRAASATSSPAPTQQRVPMASGRAVVV